jgi:hypothetical protein
MQAASARHEPAQQTAAGFVQIQDLPQKDVDTLSQRNRLLATCLGNLDVITGEASINSDDRTRSALNFADSENGGSPPHGLLLHSAIQSAHAIKMSRHRTRVPPPPDSVDSEASRARNATDARRSQPRTAHKDRTVL